MKVIKEKNLKNEGRENNFPFNISTPLLLVHLIRKDRMGEEKTTSGNTVR
jgi:hypothetical protein